MRTLFLLRHAKSDHPPGVEDRERPLNARGRAACRLLGNFLSTRELPEHVLCSDAVRTRETLERVYQTLGVAPPVMFEPSLYLATAGELLNAVHTAPSNARSLLLVAHNPGIEQLARILVRTGNPAAIASLSTMYPTGGLAMFSCPIGSWYELVPGSATLLEFITPRAL